MAGWKNWARKSQEEDATEYAFRYQFKFDGDLKRLIDYIEDLEGVEILSVGKGLELIKDLGDADVVSEQYGLNGFTGTHAIGHTRMATESDVDIRSAHPYWAYPFNDVSVVHNGQMTNYWTMRRELERRGHRFMSNCDSELIAVYIADRIDRGDELEGAMRAPSMRSMVCSPIWLPPAISLAWPRTSWLPSRWCFTKAMNLSRWLPRKSPFAVFSRMKLTPGILIEGEVRVWAA